MWSQRVRHDWVTFTLSYTHTCWTFLFLATPCGMQDPKFPDQRSNPCFAVETRILNPWTTRTVPHRSFGVNSNNSSGVEMGLKRCMFCKMIVPRHRENQKWPEITSVIQFYCMKRSLVEKLPAQKVFFSCYILVKNTLSASTNAVLVFVQHESLSSYHCQCNIHLSDSRGQITLWCVYPPPQT